MKKVKDTKAPTIKQMRIMSENLREKFLRHSDIQISADTFLENKTSELEYMLYISDKCLRKFKSWKELLFYYHIVMEESDES